MSFILDALKKSEAERQRQSPPGIADVANAMERDSPPRWIWLLAALLGINLLALAYVMLRPDPQRVATTPVVRTTPAPAATAGKSGVEEKVASPSFSEIVADAKKRQADPETSTAPAAQQAVTTAAPAPVASQPVATPPAAPSTLTTAYPTLNELLASGAMRLPELHLDIHVYAQRQADRFVFINMNKYKERATLAEGPVVKEIVPEGVILEYRGSDFLLPRQ